MVQLGCMVQLARIRMLQGGECLCRWQWRNVDHPNLSTALDRFARHVVQTVVFCGDVNGLLGDLLLHHCTITAL